VASAGLILADVTVDGHQDGMPGSIEPHQATVQFHFESQCLAAHLAWPVGGPGECALEGDSQFGRFLLTAPAGHDAAVAYAIVSLADRDADGYLDVLGNRHHLSRDALIPLFDGMNAERDGYPSHRDQG
jgi:hypothetical protein